MPVIRYLDRSGTCLFLNEHRVLIFRYGHPRAGTLDSDTNAKELLHFEPRLPVC